MKFLEKIKEIYGKIIDEKKNDLTREEKEFLPGALEIVETPAAPKAYWLMWLVIGIFILALLWAIFGTVDEVAVATGKVVPAGYTKTIQAEDKGVVKHILVKDGDNVKAGDVLIELDPTITNILKFFKIFHINNWIAARRKKEFWLNRSSKKHIIITI